MNKGIILAAGRGSRMGNLTEAAPKCLVELNGKPLYEWQRQALTEGGCNSLGVVTGYRGELLERPGVKRFTNSRWSETQMLRSLLSASEWLETDKCVVSYSDIFYSSSIVKELLEHSGDIVLPYFTGWRALWSLRFENPLSDLESFELNSDSSLKEIGQRTDSLDKIKGQYMGIFLTTPKGWEQAKKYLGTLEKGLLDRLDMTTFFRGLLERGVRVDTLPYSGLWLEVDTESDLRIYQDQFLKNKEPQP